MQCLVLSVINYCIDIWASTNNALLHTVQKLQNFAGKVAVGAARKCDHVTPIMKELKWLNVEDKCVVEKCSTVYRAVNGLFPEWYLKFLTVGQNTESTTRHENNLYLQRSRTDSGAKESTVCGSKLWNLIPHDIVNSRNLHGFKASLKKLLLTNEN